MTLLLSPSPNASFFSPRQQQRRHGLRHRLLPRRPRASSSPPPAEHGRTGAVIVGAGLAGLAGLAAATRLHAAGVPFLLLEASDAVGGRVRTDAVDGFLLDRGFQIFITAYPEVRKLLNYDALDLQKFYSGALVYHGGGCFHRVADPIRHPLDGLASLANPVGTVADKVRVGLARLRAVVRSDEEILTAAEVQILDRLRSDGFTDSMIDRFFRPFFGGIFFDRDLETTSRLFDFVFKCLALGDNALPARGIAAIPEQLAEKLPPGTVRLGSRVAAVDLDCGPDGSRSVRLDGGEVIKGDLGLIVAVEEPEAEKLLPRAASASLRSNKNPARSTVCLYFAADRAPVRDPVLILNGTGEGRVNNMFFATNVAPSYGPEGKTLVSVSLIGKWESSDDDLTAEVVRELGGWFGEGEVGSWRHLRTYRIGFAQPDQRPPTDLGGKDPTVEEGVYVCGDHRESATFDGALVSGRRAAEALIRDRVLWPSRMTSSLPSF